MTRYLLGDAIIGTHAERTAGTFGAAPAIRAPFGLFLESDTGKLYVETGSAWTLLSQVGIPVDTSGNVAIGGNVTIGGTITAASTSVPAAPTAGANAGTTPPAPVLVPGSNDVAGSITFGTGTTPALGDMVDVVFGTAYAATPRAILVTATNAVTGLKIPCTVAKSTTGFSIGLAVAPAGSQANTVYAVDYLVVE